MTNSNNSNRIKPSFLLIICSLPLIVNFGMVQKVIAQTNTNDSILSPEGGNVLVDDVIQNLKNKDINKALVHLNILKQQIAIILRQSPDLNSTAPAQIVKILLSDTTQAVKNGDTNQAIANLNLMMKKVPTLSEFIKISLGDAINSLQSNNSKGALVYLNLINSGTRPLFE